MVRHLALCTMLLAASPAFAAGYEAGLDPTPFDATNRADVLGSIGTATADLKGNVLTVSGSFSNLTSNATGGSLRIGLAKGVPGDAIGTVTADHAKDGKFLASVKLTGAQITALNKQSLYIRIDSEKAPDGNLQGWLEGTN
jgi:hypothetical protein